MRSLPLRRARDRRRTFLSGGGIGLFHTFRPWIEILEDRRMLACDVDFRDGALLVLGDDSDNAVAITVGLRRVQVTCDGNDAGTFAGVRALRVLLGGGNDGMAFNAEESLGADAIQDTNGDGVPEIVDGFGGAGADTFVILASAAALLRLDGGDDSDRVDIQFGRLFGAVQVADQGTEGRDVLRAIGTRFGDKVDIAGGDEAAWIVKWEGPRLDGSGGTEVAIESIEISHEGLELGEVKGGDGDDEICAAGPFTTPLHLFGQGGNDLGSWSKVSGLSVEWDVVEYDGGEGSDHFRVTTTNLEELLEIIGLADLAVPDPLIRVTNLATGQIDQELFIVNAEAIAVDARGGNDRVTMRDDQGPLANVNWTLVAGAGNDQIDAVLQSNPNEFFVQAGLGDDDVSIRFVGIPTLPGPNEPLPVIDVDMGAGVDGLLLDVFGSRESPPVDFATAGIAPSVTLTEVLASILISGVGLMALLTLFPLGSLEMAQAIRDDRAGHIKESSANVAIVLNGADLAADVKTGAAADEIMIDVLPQPDSDVRIDVSTGAGDDRVDVHSRSEEGPLDLALAIDPGTSLEILPEVGDEVLVAFEHGDINRPVVIGALWNGSAPPTSSDRGSGQLLLHAVADAERVLFDLDLLGSVGADVVRVDASSSQEASDPADTLIYIIDISGNMRGGDDSFTYSGLKGPPVRKGSWILDTTFDVDMGAGNDQVAALLETPAEEVNQKVQIDTGDGADGLTVVLRRLANPHLPPETEEPSGLDDLAIHSGAGDDTIEVQLESVVAAMVQKVQIDSGAGNDRVSVNAEDAQRDGLADFVVGADAGESPGAGPHVKVFDGRSGATADSFDPYGASFAGGVRVASGDVNGDGVADIITGAGPGAGAHVKVFDGASGAEIRSFFAYGASFAGGVYVAAGDVNGDGWADIITGAGAGAPGGHVKVFDGRTGAELRSFFAYGAGFSGGVRVAAGDVNGDGQVDIVTGAGPGAGPHVKVFDGASGAEIRSFFAYTPSFAGGVFVAAGDVTGDGRADIVTGADAGTPGGHVKVFDGGSLVELHSFFAYDASFAGGVRVAAGDVTGDGMADVVTGAGPGAAGGHVKVFDGTTGGEIRSFFAFDPSFAGGIFVAAGDLNSSARPRSLELGAAIDAGAGNDAVALRLSADADELWQKVRVDAGAGSDSVALQLLPYLEQDNLYQFHVDGGSGNDTIHYWVFGTELPPAAVHDGLEAPGGLDLDVLGGLGSDEIQGRVGIDRLGHFVPLALGQARLNIDGGAGHDRIALEFHGTIMDGESVDAVLRGGVGNDQVWARFDLLPFSAGQLSAQVLGDAGNDELALAVIGGEQLDEFFALLDGGKGRDKCRATKNVLVRNCEQ
jgi:type VI secretion system (T6SS) baseplate-like injector VgrG/VCBS repeat protein/FG-GAP repeat protein